MQQKMVFYKPCSSISPPVSEDLIRKSFIACGQNPTQEPEDISCMKKGKPVAMALDDVKSVWNSAKVAIQEEIPDEEEDATNTIVFFED